VRKTRSVTVAVEAYLNQTPLNGAQEPLAALARLLAESLEAAPLYARASLARQLRDLLTDLEEKSAWEFERAERRAKRLSQSQWSRNGET
jgi:hypothetical protein